MNTINPLCKSGPRRQDPARATQPSVRAKEATHRAHAATWSAVGTESVHGSSAAAWIAAALMITLYHARPYVQVPQFWGEEGKVFFREAYEGGLSPILHTCEGYLHLYPRFTSFLATLLPLAWAPALAMLAALMGQGMLYLALWDPRLPLSYWGRAGCTIAVALIPNGGEVILNLTNVQWFFGPAMVLVLLRAAPQNRYQLWADAAWLFVFGTTGPYLVLFLPLAALARAAGETRLTRMEGWRWAMAAVIAVAHGSLWNTVERNGGFVSPGPTSDWGAWGATLSNVIMPFELAAWAPWMPPSIAWTWVAAAVGLLVVFSLLLFPTWREWRNPLRLGVLLCGGICYTAGIWESRHAPYQLHPYVAGQRMFFILYMAVAWLLVMTATGSGFHRAKRAAAAALLLVSGVSSLANFHRIMGRQDFHYQQQVQLFEQRGQLVFTQPPNWHYELVRQRRWY